MFLATGAVAALAGCGSLDGALSLAAGLAAGRLRIWQRLSTKGN